MYPIKLALGVCGNMAQLAQRRDIQPMLLGVALMVMVVFSLFSARYTHLSRDAWEPACLHSVAYSAHGRCHIGALATVINCELAATGFAVFGLEIFFSATFSCCFTGWTAPVSPVGRLSLCATLVSSTSYFSFATVFVFFTRCYVRLTTERYLGAYFAPRPHPVLFTIVFVERAFGLGFTAFSTRFHHILQNRKAPTRFLQIVCLGQLTPDWGASTKYNSNPSYPKRLYCNTIAPLAQGET